jgi:hypothetical protein
VPELQNQALVPTLHPPQLLWCSVIPGRKPETKVYKRKSDAMGAIAYHYNGSNSGAAYEFVAGEWVLLVEVTPRTQCDICGGPIDWTWHGTYNNRPRLIKYTYKNRRSFEQPAACGSCVNRFCDYKSPDKIQFVRRGDEAILEAKSKLTT